MGCSLKAKRASYYSFSIILVCMLLFSFVTTVRADDPVTRIGFSPSQKIVPFDSEFSIDITCTPTQPIKAYEFQLQFDPTYVEAVSVSEGDIFEGYPTFFNSGVIDNNEGVITNVYGLIVGPGTVSDPASLVTVTFHAKSNAGLSTLSLVTVGVTNEIGYVPIEKQNGVILVSDPASSHIISSITPADKSQNVALSLSELSVTIYDLEGDSFDWMMYTSPNIGSNSGTASSNGTKTCSISGLAYSTTYSWYVRCKDISTGKWTNASFWFKTVTQESLPPGDGGDDGGYFPPPFPAEGIEENTPPDQPMKPVGPTSIELGVVYSYSSSAMDADGDLIRLQFDWGDGSYSDWSAYVSSNTTVEMNHDWSNISDYDVRAIAQDEQGENSSWSEPLEVLVSQMDTQDDDVVPDDDIFDIIEVLNISNTTYFLIDLNNDGTIDICYNSITGFNSSVYYFDDNTILIDLEGDGTWDYMYDVQQKSLSSYSSISEDSAPHISGIDPWLLILVSFSILLGILVLFRHDVYLFILNVRISILQLKMPSLGHTKSLAVRVGRLSPKQHRIHFFSHSEDNKWHTYKELKKVDDDKKLKTKLYYLREEESVDESSKTSTIDMDALGKYSRMTPTPLSPPYKNIDDKDLLHEQIHSKIDSILEVHEEQLSNTKLSDIEGYVDRLFIDRLLFHKKVVW